MFRMTCPFLLAPLGFHSSALLVLSHLSVCPTDHHLLCPMSFPIEFCPVFVHISSFLILSLHFIRSNSQRLLFTKKSLKSSLFPSFGPKGCLALTYLFYLCVIMRCLLLVTLNPLISLLSMRFTAFPLDITFLLPMIFFYSSLASVHQDGLNLTLQSSSSCEDGDTFIG